MFKLLTKFKVPLLATSVVLASFVFGYYGERMKNAWNSQVETEAVVEIGPGDNSVAERVEQFSQTIKVPVKALTRPATPRQSPKPPQAAPTPFNSASSFMFVPQNPAAPYESEQFQNAAGPPPSPYPTNFGSTMDSISANQVDDKQIIKRNAYFEKLSQQLKELQGKNQVQTPEPIQEDPIIDSEKTPDAMNSEQLPADGQVPDLDDPLAEAPLDDTMLPPAPNGFPLGEDFIGDPMIDDPDFEEEDDLEF